MKRSRVTWLLSWMATEDGQKNVFLPRVAGHKKGVDSVRAVIQAAAESGVRHLSLFAFSSENWNRPADEVSALMNLFLTSLAKETSALHKANVRIRMVGDLSRFPDELQKKNCGIA